MRSEGEMLIERCLPAVDVLLASRQQGRPDDALLMAA